KVGQFSVKIPGQFSVKINMLTYERLWIINQCVSKSIKRGFGPFSLSEGRGHRFESCRVRHYNSSLLNDWVLWHPSRKASENRSVKLVSQ
ncbi:hypothetical protein, partial [Roseibium sediminis]|uniref:hypothetical protein n=1 Tax=Roseibium sediminis TaxID=1775174 RepID=UPI00195A3D7B